MRPIAIFRFSRSEGPAYFADWLDARKLRWQLVALDEGAAVPDDARAFSGIGMMGGPMSANDDLAWNAPLCTLLRAAVDEDIPVIGHCLGGQMLARSLGAAITRASIAEIGWHNVAVCDAAAQRDWFGGRAAFETFQWHYDAFALPRGATRVLTNGFNANQAYVIGGRHIGFQCHIEMTGELTESWLGSGAGELPLRSSPSAQRAADIRRDIAVRLTELHAVAGSVYARWAQGLAQ